MMRYLAVAVTSLLMAAGCWSAPSASDASPQILEQWSGAQSGRESFATLVVNDTQAWRHLWEEIGRDPPRDFPSNTTALVVFLGQRPTGGYSIAITEVAQMERYSTAVYKEQRPAADRRVAQVITSPWTVVLMPRISTPVRFVPSTAGGGDQ